MKNMTGTTGNNEIKSMIDSVMAMSAENFLGWLLIDSAEKHRQVLQMMDYLMMNTEDSPSNPYNRLMLALTSAIRDYEVSLYDIKPVDPVDLLKSFMEDHGLKQNDLPEIGPQSKVSEIIHRKKELNVRQIRNLSRRFNISPSAFISA
jgi:HTH-type transcriptional regulator / antitoxin HigA